MKLVKNGAGKDNLLIIFLNKRYTDIPTITVSQYLFLIIISKIFDSIALLLNINANLPTKSFKLIYLN